ncbi:MAG: chromate transporter [Candidatus Riflebacteria bacterium]|nr:chromate transporter [Candidatus Riflebacteria bacterium]
MKLLLELFLCFFKIGLFTFGGGYAMIALIENACVEEKKWITHDEMMNVTVIAESTPGPIAINCATFVGYKQKGFWGAIAATIGVVLPSLIIIYLIALYFKSFLEVKLIANAFEGIKAAVGIIIIDAGLNMYKKMKDKSFLTVAILVVNLILVLLVSFFDYKLSTVVLMLSSGFLTLIIFSIKQISNKNVEDSK